MTEIEFELTIKKEDELDGPPVWTVESTDHTVSVRESFADALVLALRIIAVQLEEKS